MAFSTWWENLPNAHNYVDEISRSCIESGDSILLILPRNLPWPEEFEQILGIRLREDSNKSLKE